MKYTTEQLILAAHVRALALDLWKRARNAAFEKAEAENPADHPSMEVFTAEFAKTNSLGKFIPGAMAELERVVDITLEGAQPQ